MIEAWIVIREEKHVDPKYWVCLKQEDALAIARDVAAYWQQKYEQEGDEVDTACYGNAIFAAQGEDSFAVFVYPQSIREAGEIAQAEVSYG